MLMKRVLYLWSNQSTFFRMIHPKLFRREVYPDGGTSIGKPVWDHPNKKVAEELPFFMTSFFKREVYPDRGTSIGKPVWDHETLTILSGFFLCPKLFKREVYPDRGTSIGKPVWDHKKSPVWGFFLHYNINFLVKALFPVFSHPY